MIYCFLRLETILFCLDLENAITSLQDNLVFNFKINDDVNMTLNVFKNKIKDIYKIAQKNNKISFHLEKGNPLLPFV